MKAWITRFMTFFAVVLLWNLSSTALAQNTNPPDRMVRLIFIHHSTGEAWLADDYGNLGVELMNNNYFVSDTNYDWGPDSPLGGPIGSYTDIGHWWTWFRSSNKAAYLDALYKERLQHCGYTRSAVRPRGKNVIIMFKSCFPNSALKGNPDDPVPLISANPLRGKDSGSDFHTVANAKGIYIDLLKYFAKNRDKLFIVISAPPLTDPYWSANARAFNQWLVNDWLKDYPHRNVFVFDYYNVLTTNGGSSDTNDLDLTTGNHHRWRDGAIEHVVNGDDDDNPNVLEYPTGDDHPSSAGDLKATGEFIKLLNIAYNRWRPSLGEALDNDALAWTSGGDSGWLGETDTYVYQGDAARSGGVVTGKSSYLQTTVEGPGTLSFFWRVSSQLGQDILRFSIDGVVKAKISGERQWKQKSYEIGAGSHEIRWVYKKNAAISAGSDAGWVDGVEWTGPVGVAVQPLP